MPTETVRPLSKEVASERRNGAEALARSETGDPRREEPSVRKCLKLLFCVSEGSDSLCASLREIMGQAAELNQRVIEVFRTGEGNPGCFSSRAKASEPDLIFLILAAKRPTQAVSLVRAVRASFGSCPVIAVTEGMDGSELYSLLRLGASDFVTAPLRSAEVLPRVRRLLNQTSGEDALVLGLKEKLGLKQLIGESPALLAEIEKLPLIARCDATVLIAGETGTGKEMFAKAIHFLSPRSAKPFSPINCGALPVDLAENELFGHDPGAFTGANSSSLGLIRETDGGSLFLDEVDTLPPLAQVKLLRFLQEKEFRPLGAHKACRADVRVLAASNRNLEEAVRAGRFREDLYYRLNVIRLVLPPLRERKEDIPLLARHFVAKHVAAVDEPPKELAMATLQKLMLYDWPGNVRELENVIERCVVLSCQTILRPDDIKLPTNVPVNEGESFQDLKAKIITQFERGYIQELLRAHNGNITRAAQAAGKHRRAFWEVMRKHQINTSS